MAVRSVSGLSPTSTMRARPLSSKWVREFVMGRIIALAEKY
jgi:hypothetical protein